MLWAPRKEIIKREAELPPPQEGERANRPTSSLRCVPASSRGTPQRRDSKPTVASGRAIFNAERFGLGSALLVAALLRFPTLRLQSFWDDEGNTVRLMRMTLGGMIRAVPNSESTPPPYYVIAWLWSHGFGIDEWGLRSLSALFGAALVPVAYATGVALGAKRAGMIAAFLVATNPLLIWYSQEARVYALLTLVAGLSFLAFIGALRRDSRRSIALWCAASIVALLTHYFAVFLVAPEACVLLYRRRNRSAIGAVAVLSAVGLALLPLALVQRSRGYVFHDVPLKTRILQVPEQFLVGYGVWYATLGKLAAIVTAIAWAYGLLALRRRSSAAVVAAVAVTAVALLLPIMLAAVGLDYVLALYFLALVGPTVILVSVGLSRAPNGIVAAVCVVAIGLAIVSVVETHPQFQREDLRSVAHAVDRDRLSKAIVITPPSVLTAYLPSLRGLGSGRPVKEVVLVAMAQKDPGKPPSVPRSFSRRLSIPGFHLVEVLAAPRFTLVRFRADHPQVVTAGALKRNRIRGGNVTGTDVLFEP